MNNNRIISYFEEKLNNKELVSKWIKKQYAKYPTIIYNSMDIRYSGFKILVN